MRYGVTIPFEHLPGSALREQLEEAGRLGIEEAWSYERNVFDAFTPLAAAATAHPTMRLGTSIVPVFTRPPGLLAMSAAGLAELAPGRFVLGVGGSTETIVTGWMGVPFAKPLQRVRETILTVRALLGGERVGKLTLYRPPATPPPIYMAALGERMLRLAGEIADGVAFFMASAGSVPGLLRGTGRELDSVARVIVLCGQDHAQNVAFARRFITGYAILPFYARFLESQGWGEAVRAIQRRWEAGDRAGANQEVPEEMAESLMLIETDPRLTDRVREYERSGLGTLDLWFMSPAGTEAQRAADTTRALHRLAPRTPRPLSREPV
ncbi:MAG: LLM class flavin-dependent oxidoreductase [Candidatus Dormibacteraeota bacterium]|nr:LLM class flavin-dependent oxidoreductase [Candidatus Dormibacteraeota bacterium]